MGRNNEDFLGVTRVPMSEVEDFIPSDYCDSDWDDPIRVKHIDRETFDNYTVHKHDYDELKQDISKHGMKSPISATRLSNGETLLTEGHHRAVIAKELGFSHVPVRFS
jgi:hypothetical protein